MSHRQPWAVHATPFCVLLESSHLQGAAGLRPSSTSLKTSSHRILRWLIHRTGTGIILLVPKKVRSYVFLRNVSCLLCFPNRALWHITAILGPRLQSHGVIARFAASCCTELFLLTSFFVITFLASAARACAPFPICSFSKQAISLP